MLIIMNPPYHNRMYKSIIKQVAQTYKDVVALCPWEFVDHPTEVTFQAFVDERLSDLVKVDNSRRQLFDIGKAELALLRLGDKRLNLYDYQIHRESFESEICKDLVAYNTSSKFQYKCYVQPNRQPEKFRNLLTNTNQLFAKACRGHFHFGGKNFDYLFNTTKNPRIIYAGEDNLKIGQDIILLDMYSDTCKENLVRWIFSSRLAQRLVDEYKRDDHYGIGRFDAFIPFVDWSHPWTDKEILKEIGLPED